MSLRAHDRAGLRSWTPRSVTRSSHPGAFVSFFQHARENFLLHAPRAWHCTRPPAILPIDNSMVMEASTEPKPDTGRCNLCHGTTFAAQGVRERVRCTTCGSLERTRVAMLVLDALGVLDRPLRVLHFAPERGLHQLFSAQSRYEYVPCDFDPSRYPPGCRKVDMRLDLMEFASSSFDLVIHNHVLEHVACNYTWVLRELDRIVAPDGLHLFSVPIRDGHYAESFDPAMPKAERTRLFLQHDHVRVFGSRDIEHTLGRVYTLPAQYDVTRWLDESVLARCNVPVSSWRGYSGHSVFCFKKTSLGMSMIDLEAPKP
jgi:phosphoglycolate phosphatase